MALSRSSIWCNHLLLKVGPLPNSLQSLSSPLGQRRCGASAANASAPNSSAPNAGAPNASAPNSGAPNASAPNSGAPNASAPNAPKEQPVCPKAQVVKREPLDTTFNDHVAAFRSKYTSELVRSYVVFTMCSIDILVSNNAMLMDTGRTVLGDWLFGKLMKCTFFGHFVGGEDLETVKETLKRLQSFGVKSILDYSVEEDLSHEEAEKRENKSLQAVPKSPEPGNAPMPQFVPNEKFADRRANVDSARTYFYLNEATCDNNAKIFAECLKAVSAATSGTGITAVKLTALGRPPMLLLLSEVIMRARQYMAEMGTGKGNVMNHNKTIQDLERYLGPAGDNQDVKQFLGGVTADKKGIIHLFPWSGIVDENCELSNTFRLPDPKTGQMRRLISQIPPKEEQMFRNMIRRVTSLVKTAKEVDVRIMIDAEQTYFQPAISRITLEMMRKYNKGKAIVFSTYQCYLKETYNEITTDFEQAERQDFYFGAKLVRGAYLEQERARAADMKYPDPTNPDYNATSAMYHKVLGECLRRMKIFKDCKEKKLRIMVASHNEETVKFALEQMKSHGITPEDKVLYFGQLYGMCDFITFPLGQSGYSVFKYIPYGPVNEVLPYLSRRAQENRGVLKKLKKEKTLLRKEIFRRIMSGDWFYKPKGNYFPV